jgi:hypothetical protein
MGGDVYFSSSGINFYGASASEKSLSMSSSGGTLHGTWSSDNVVSSSDRRLKKDVAPLLSHVLQVSDGAEEEAAEPSAWLLRQLRPVSFTRTSSEKRSFGFIAQELEKLVPDVVQPLHAGQSEDEFTSDLKGVVYQDLIALLTVFAQQNLLRLERTERRVELLSVDRETLRADLDALHVIVADLRKENAGLRADLQKVLLRSDLDAIVAELREEDAGLRTDLQKIMARLDHLDKPGEVTDVHNKIAALQDRQAQDQ